MATTVNTFSAVSNPTAFTSQWAGTSGYGIRDSVTGDLVFWSYGDNAQNPTAICSSQNNGATWARLATDATNPTSDWSKPLGAVQDSNGAVHFLTYSQPMGYAGYGRATLTRTSGHVTGYTWAVQPFALPMHSLTYPDIRGGIYVFTMGGVEKVVYAFMGSTASQDDIIVYSARSTSLTPSTAANFTALDSNTASTDSLLTNVSDVSGLRWEHTHAIAMAQIGSTEDLYLFCGPFDNDQAQAPGGTPSLDDLWFRQLPKSGSNWTVGSSSSLGTTIVAGASGVPIPNIIEARGNSSRAWVQYTDGANGVCFAYIDSGGTLHANAITSPLSTSGRNGFGTFSVDNSNQIWTIFNTYGPSGSTTPTGKLAYWDGSTWATNTTDSTAAECVAIIQFTGWANGAAAVRIPGDPVAQTVTGLLDGAAIFTTGPTNNTLSGATGSYALTGKTGTFTYFAPAHSDAWPIGGNIAVGMLLSGSAGAPTNYSLSGVVGSYAIAGQAGTFTYTPGASATNYTLSGAVGSYTYTGNAATFKVAHTLSGVTGSYALTGRVGGLQVNRSLSGATGSYSLTGTVGTFSYVPGAGSIPYALSGSTGTYVLTGNTATLQVTRTLSGTTGSYLLTGRNGSFKVAHTLSGSVGSYTYTGRTGTLTYHAGSGGTPVWPLPSQVADGVYYGPTGADYLGTNIGNLTVEITTGQLIKPLTSGVSIML